MFWVSCLGTKATIPPPETFEQVREAADLIALVKIEAVEVTGDAPVKAIVVERFKGEPAHGIVNIAWPQTLDPKHGEKYYLSPKVGVTFYAFLKRRETGIFSNFSVWWSFYLVREAPSEKGVQGRKIHHRDCYWELGGNSAVRFAYSQQSKVSKWPVEYVAKSGDSLWKLAGEYYEDPTRWERILKANSWMTDPSNLKVGAKISIPSISDYD